MRLFQYSIQDLETPIMTNNRAIIGVLIFLLDQELQLKRESNPHLKSEISPKNILDEFHLFIRCFTLNGQV